MLNAKHLFFLIFLVSNFHPNIIFAQRNSVRVDGTVQEEKNNLDKVSITVYENEQFFTKALTESNGKFRFQLNYDADYILEFSKPGYVTKKFAVNTEGISMEDQDFGHEYGNWNVALFKPLEGMDLSMFDKPYAKIYYNQETRKFKHDVEYTELVKKEFAQLQKDFEKKKKEEAKRKKEEEKAAASEEKKKIEMELAAKKEEEKKKKEEAKLANAVMEEEQRKKQKQQMVKIEEKKKFNKQEYKDNDEKLISNSANKARRDTGDYKTKEEFLQALAKLYPQGITEEIYMDGNVKVTRRIVVDGNSGNEYKFTEHPWGGKFWFKNGTPINESIWNVETQAKK